MTEEERRLQTLGYRHGLGVLDVEELDAITDEDREHREFKRGDKAGRSVMNGGSDPYRGAGESSSLPFRTEEMHKTLAEMPRFTESDNVCAKCLFGRNAIEYVNTVFVVRYYIEGGWGTVQPGHSNLKHGLMQRSCPQCQYKWFEAPADYSGKVKR